MWMLCELVYWSVILISTNEWKKKYKLLYKGIKYVNKAAELAQYWKFFYTVNLSKNVSCSWHQFTNSTIYNFLSKFLSTFFWNEIIQPFLNLEGASKLMHFTASLKCIILTPSLFKKNIRRLVKMNWCIDVMIIECKIKSKFLQHQLHSVLKIREFPSLFGKDLCMFWKLPQLCFQLSFK